MAKKKAVLVNLTGTTPTAADLAEMKEAAKDVKTAHLPPVTDERIGLPSMSGLERLANCPGSWTLGLFVQALYKARARAANDAAASGTRIHSALSGEETELSRYEEFTRTRCESYEADVLAKLLTDYGFTPDEVYREQRYEFRNPVNEVLATGRDDVLYICKKLRAALVIDYKTGTIGAGNVELNHQLTGYGVLAYQHFIGLETIFVALIQPNAPEKVSVAVLSSDDCKRAEAGIAAIIEKATSGSTERHADIEKQCKYCPAKAFCPEYLKVATVELEAMAEIVGPISKDEIDETIYVAPIERVIQLYEKRGILTAINEAVAARMKRQLASNPESVPGYELGSSGSVRSLPNNDVFDAAFEKMKDLATYGEFQKLFKLAVTDLEAFHKERSGLKGKACENDFKVRFGSLIVSSPKEPMIRKKKKELA